MPIAFAVDDDPAIRKMLAEVLTQEGYSVQTAVHGGPALDIMHASPEHLVVILGLIMPEVDGLEVLEALAADPALTYSHTIVVVCRFSRTTPGNQPFTVEQLLDALLEAWAGRVMPKGTKLLD